MKKIFFNIKTLIILLVIEINFCKIVQSNSYVIKNPSSPLQVSIHPDFGNFVSQIQFESQEILYSPYYKLNQKVGTKLEGIPLLFPFANRLEKWAIPLKNELFPLDPNSLILKDQSNLPMHGFFYYKTGWKVVDFQNLKEKSFYESVYTSNSEDEKLFPFSFELKMRIELEGNILHYILWIKNSSSENMPLSVGFHPYFLLPLDIKSKTKVFTNAKKVYLTNSNLIPNGKLESSSKILKDEFLSKQFIDHTFFEFDSKGVVNLYLPDKTLSIILEEGFDHIQIFNPLDKDFICIEPMLGPINSFFTKKNYTLSPSNIWKGVWKLKIDKVK